MPTRGPIPKRAALRRRRNKPAVPLLKAVSAGVGLWPAADPAWHPLAKAYYQALQVSGQSQFYEATDVAYARVNTQVLHQLLSGSGARSGHGMSSMLLAAWDVGASKLMVTEADRRRLRVELEKGEPVEPPWVRSMAKYRANLAATPTVN